MIMHLYPIGYPIVLGTQIDYTTHFLKHVTAMTKVECKMSLKHHVDNGRRLKKAGMYDAATERRMNARILRLTYKRHYSETTG